MTKKKVEKIKKGVVVSNKMEKTLVVAVDSFKTHPKYLKKYKSTKKYKVHTTNSGNYEIGDVVKFVSVRPISKNKKFAVLNEDKK